MKKALTIIAILFLMAGFSAQARAYSFSAYGSMTGAKTLAVNPFLYGAIGPFDARLDLVAGYGISDRFDCFANIAGLFYDGFGGFNYAGSWVMPRFDLGANNILALMAGEEYDPVTGAAGFYLYPQYHFFWENTRTAFEINGGVSIPLDAPETATAYLYFAPVLKIVDGTFHVFCELDSYYVAAGEEKGFNLAVMPGVWFGFGEEALHQFSVGLSISDWWNGGKLDGAPSLSWNIWYWTTFSLGGE